MSEQTFTLPAFAKINLSLRVHGRRADGYHEVSTVLQTVTLRDLLTFAPLAGARFELVCDSLEAPADATNIVHRAGVLLRERFGVTRGARVVLEKSIPSGGGLGGGSADAAVALVGLAHLWDLKTTKRELSELGARLGADVPFFFTGGTALGRGTGAEIAPLADAPPMRLVVVTPAVKVPTAEAYKALKAPALTKAEAAVNLPISHAEADFSDFRRGGMRNDFEAVVIGLYPEIGRAKDALVAAGASAAMLSGSGSSVFGIFDSEGEAESALGVLGVAAGWRVFPCSTLGRGEYLASFGACAGLLGD